MFSILEEVMAMDDKRRKVKLVFYLLFTISETWKIYKRFLDHLGKKKKTMGSIQKDQEGQLCCDYVQFFHSLWEDGGGSRFPLVNACCHAQILCAGTADLGVWDW